MAPKDRVPLVRAGLAVASLLLLLCAARCEARAMAARRLRSGSSSPMLNALFKLNFIRTVEPPRRLPIPTAGEEAASDTNSPFCVNPPDALSAATPSSTPFAPSFPGQAPQLPSITPVPPSFEPSPPENGAPGAGQGGDQGQGGGGGGGDQGQRGGQAQGGGGGDQGQGEGQGQGGGGGGQAQGGGGGDQGQGGGGGDQGQGGGQGQEGPPASTTPSSPPQVGPGTPFGSVPPSPIVVVPSPPGFVPGPGSSLGGGSGGPFQPPIIYPPPLAPPLPPGARQTLWCVAKPTVPDPIIQEAMDYACGAGAGCDSIMPSGACYRPNTVLAHASFAFNSYWQQAKATGGTCDFGGTATIVTRDPSYEECKFDLL